MTINEIDNELNRIKDFFENDSQVESQLAQAPPIMDGLADYRVKRDIAISTASIRKTHLERARVLLIQTEGPESEALKKTDPETYQLYLDELKKEQAVVSGTYLNE